MYVFPPLDAQYEYYGVWAFRMQTLLKKKDCWGAIRDQRPAPAEEDNQKAYDWKSRKALGLMMEKITNFVIRKAKLHENCGTAAEMWNAIKMAYENELKSNRFNLLYRLVNLRMKESDEIELHFSQLDAIVYQLRLSGAETANDDLLLTAVLLASMPPSFFPAVTVMLMSCGTDPTLEEVKSRLRYYALIRKLSAAKKSGGAGTATVMTATADEYGNRKKNRKRGKSQHQMPICGFRGRGFGYSFGRGQGTPGRGRHSF